MHMLLSMIFKFNFCLGFKIGLRFVLVFMLSFFQKKISLLSFVATSVCIFELVVTYVCSSLFIILQIAETTCTFNGIKKCYSPSSNLWRKQRWLEFMFWTKHILNHKLHSISAIWTLLTTKLLTNVALCYIIFIVCKVIKVFCFISMMVQ
jgi:hypothetical protein